MKRLMFLCLFVILGSCSGTGKNLGLLLNETGTKETQIFVKRETGMQGVLALVKVSLNGMEIGSLGDEERLSSPTNVGSGILSVKYEGLASIGSSGSSRSFIIERGKKLYFVIKQDIGLLGSKLKTYTITKNEFFSND